MQTALTPPSGPNVHEIKLDRQTPGDRVPDGAGVLHAPIDVSCGQTLIDARVLVHGEAVDRAVGHRPVRPVRRRHDQVLLETQDPATPGSFLHQCDQTRAYTEPFQLGPGVHRIWFFSEDVADNVEATKQAPILVRVDDEAPHAREPAPIPPTRRRRGLVRHCRAGWHHRVLQRWARHAGLHRPFARAHRQRRRVLCGDPCISGLIKTGEHLYHAAAVDRLGNRSLDTTLSFKVDLVRPRTPHRAVARARPTAATAGTTRSRG